MTVEISILKLPQTASKWYLVNSYMELRERVFIRRKNWTLLSRDSFEFEQYDTATYPYYVLAHEGEKVIAGCRLIRCDQSFGNLERGDGYSYMINDAYHGRIDLPSDICTKAPPTSSEYWELTRLCAERGYRKDVLAVMRATYIFLQEQRAKGCLCLASPAVQRIAEISGYPTESLGPMVTMADEEKFSAFSIPIELQA